ncbi:type II toxin-antitoxin system RelE/ParE family toxin [Pseudochelatococcus sp. B33]
MVLVEWRPTALEDLLAIVDYISDENPDAAQRLKGRDSGKAQPSPGASQALSRGTGGRYT